MPRLFPRPLAAALAFAISFLPAAAAHAQQTGIAFAYAPEQGSGMCVGGSPAAALVCARQKCTESGAAAEDCARVAWCFPAGWSFSVGIMHKEGIHWSEFSCGWPSREAALAAAQVRCDAAYRNYMQDCAMGELWDEAGKPVAVEGGM